MWPHRYSCSGKSFGAHKRVFVPLLAGLLVILFAGHSQPAHAVFADPAGGSGKYERVIDWIDWGSASTTNIAPGESYSTWSDPTLVWDGFYRTNYCTLTDISAYSSSDGGASYQASANPIRVGYNPGTWRGDGFARLYNNGQFFTDGVPNSPHIRPLSELRVGVGNAVHGRMRVAEYSYFTVDCTSYLVESATKPSKDAIPGLPKTELTMEGIAVADVETSNWSYAKESITIRPTSIDGAPATARFLESTRSPECTTNSWLGEGDYTFKDGTTAPGIQVRPDSQECAYPGNRWWGPASVVFLENANGGRVEIRGGGITAIAFGVVSHLDFGDAPESYGDAGSLYQPVWTGGAPGTDIAPGTFDADPGPGLWYNLSEAELNGQGATTTGPLLRLGAVTDFEATPGYSADAAGDDITDSAGGNQGPDDEDALDGWDGVIRTTTGGSYQRSVACGGDGQVRGWVDWNRDGVFGEGEGSDQVDCVAGSATLTWDVPADAKRSIAGEAGSDYTFMRLRISADKQDGWFTEIRPTGLTLSGEVEDYRVQVHTAMLTVLKVVDNSVVFNQTGLAATDWTLTATSALPRLSPSGPGGFENMAVNPGPVVLSESSAVAGADSYQVTSVQCVNHPDSAEPVQTSVFDPATMTIDMRNQDWMVCTITNQAKLAGLTWQKVDIDGSTLLGGSSWVLAGPGVPADTVVSDCETATCPGGDYTDQDPDPGQFEIAGLPWDSYTISEVSAPAGYELLTGTLAFDPISATNRTASLTDYPAGVVNQRLDGSVSWQKTDTHGNLLQGSTWTLNGPGVPAGTVVSDCVAADVTACPSSDYVDTDPAAGVFKVTGLEWSDSAYSLVEKTPPPGYVIDAKVHTFTIDRQARDFVFATAFTNEPVPAPAIPLTGGLSADIFRFGGAGLLGAAFLFWIAGGIRRVRTF